MRWSDRKVRTKAVRNEESRPLTCPRAPLVSLYRGLDALGARHLALGLEAFLEGDYPRLGQ